MHSASSHGKCTSVAFFLLSRTWSPSIVSLNVNTHPPPPPPPLLGGVEHLYSDKCPSNVLIQIFFSFFSLAAARFIGTSSASGACGGLFMFSGYLFIGLFWHLFIGLFWNLFIGLFWHLFIGRGLFMFSGYSSVEFRVHCTLHWLG